MSLKKAASIAFQHGDSILLAIPMALPAAAALGCNYAQHHGKRFSSLGMIGNRAFTTVAVVASIPLIIWTAAKAIFASMISNGVSGVNYLTKQRIRSFASKTEKWAFNKQVRFQQTLCIGILPIFIASMDAKRVYQIVRNFQAGNERIAITDAIDELQQVFTRLGIGTLANPFIGKATPFLPTIYRFLGVKNNTQPPVQTSTPTSSATSSTPAQTPKPASPSSTTHTAGSVSQPIITQQPQGAATTALIPLNQPATNTQVSGGQSIQFSDALLDMAEGGEMTQIAEMIDDRAIAPVIEAIDPDLFLKLTTTIIEKLPKKEIAPMVISLDQSIPGGFKSLMAPQAGAILGTTATASQELQLRQVFTSGINAKSIQKVPAQHLKKGVTTMITALPPKQFRDQFAGFVKHMDPKVLLTFINTLSTSIPGGVTQLYMDVAQEGSSNNI